MLTPFYDPNKSYEENFEQCPFGAFADGEVVEQGESSLKFYFMGFKVNSPFGIPAGPLINGKFAQASLDKGFDIVTYKTVRTEKYSCHPCPNVLAVKKVLKNIHKGQILVGAFQRTKKEGQSTEGYVDNFVLAARLMKESSIKIMEVNFSCPNEGTSELLCYDTQNSVKVVKAIKAEIKNVPLIVKISYFKDDTILGNFVREVVSVVQGFSAINTIFSEMVDEKGGEALPGRTHSGVCGASIKWAGLDMVKRLKKLREEYGYSYAIIGVGGVMNADDFFEYRDAGADIVMSATGAMWNPYLAKEIKERLR